MCAASHSVETSGSLVAVMANPFRTLVMAGLVSAIHVLASYLAKGRGCPGHLARRRASRFCPGMTVVLPLLLRLPLLDRAAGVAPGGETAAHMGDRLQAHVLRGLGRERRTKPAGA